MADDTAFSPPRRSPVVTWLVAGIAAGLAIAWLVFARPKLMLDEAIHSAGVGQMLPLLELHPLTGTAEGLSLELLHGKVALVNYWGTWCGPCREEFPHMVDLWQEFRVNPEFAFVSVSSTFADREPVDAVRQETSSFLRQHDVTFPTYIDAEGASRQALAMIMGRPSLGYPTTVLLDRRGTIRAIWVGYVPGSEKQMQQLISQLLAEKDRNEAASKETT